MAAGGAHHLGGQGGGLAVLLRVLVLHGNSRGHQHLPEVSGEPHSFEGEEGVSVDIILRSSGEGQVSQAEGVGKKWSTISEGWQTINPNIQILVVPPLRF